MLGAVRSALVAVDVEAVEDAHATASHSGQLRTTDQQLVAIT